MTTQSDRTEYPLKAPQNFPDYFLELNYAELHCDENELRKHLVQVIKYDEIDASTRTQEIVAFLNRERNTQYEPLQLTNKDITAEIFRVIIQCISPAQRYKILSDCSLDLVTALTHYRYWKRDDIVEIILDSINKDECYNLLKLSNLRDWSTPLKSACESGNTELVMIIRRHVSKDNWYQLLLQQSGFFCSPLQSAVSGGHIDIVKYIHRSVTAKQWYELLKLKSWFDNIALHEAASRGHTEVMMLIHQSVTAKLWYALLQMKNEHEFTALNTAASEGNTHIIDFIRETLPTAKWMSLLTVPPPLKYSIFRYDTKRIEDFVRIEIKVQLAINSSSEQGNFNFSFAKFSRFLDKK